MEKTFGQSVREERERRGLSQAELATLANTTQQSIDRIERDAVKRSRSMLEVAVALSLPLPAKVEAVNAVVGGVVGLDGGQRMPLYGHAVGGKHGEFVLNGNKIDDILAPPMLRGVREAYGVYVVGESMEPRYFAGEVLYINPRVPIRKGDFVVAQIAQDEHSAPLAYVKRFVSKGDTLKLEQFNPHEILEFNECDVVSIHKVVMAGEG